MKYQRLSVKKAAVALVLSVSAANAFHSPTFTNHKIASTTTQLFLQQAQDATANSKRVSKRTLSAVSVESYSAGNIQKKNDVDQFVTSLQQSLPFGNLRHSIVPVLSAALLITGNTVGAGCLVMPELAQGPGMAATTAIFSGAWLVNLLSGLIIAQIAISQKEQADASGSDDDDAAAVPASFQDFAQANLQSDAAAKVISSISLFVNACVMAFDLNRAGIVGSAVLGPTVAPATISCVWAATLIALLSTQTSTNLSKVCSALVTALFVSFGGLLLPGLASVADPVATWAAPGTSPDCMSCVAHIAPIILTSMQYQNIVPTVTKMLNYDRAQTVASLVVGSSIPFAMYFAWCFASLGGGIDTSVLSGAGAGNADGITTALLTMFSLATLAGSSMGSGMSLSEELGTHFSSGSKEKSSENKDVEEQESSPSAFPFQASFAAVSLPLVASVAFGGTEGGLTNALSLAGSFGSPLLYGAIPALIAFRQQQQNRENKNDVKNLVPQASLPLLGLLSTGFVGQEVVQRMGEALALAT